MVATIFVKNDVCATLRPVYAKRDAWPDDVISGHGCLSVYCVVHICFRVVQIH